MEREQSFLFNKEKTEIPNIYFSKNGNYSSSQQSTDMNPNIIADQCKNITGDGITGDIPSNDPNYDSYINNNTNFNNFVYNYSIGKPNTTSYSNKKIVKDQLDYLTCQLLKSKNKEFDTSNYTLSTIDLLENSVPRLLAILILIWLISSYFIFIFKKNSPFYNNFEFDKLKGKWFFVILKILLLMGIVSGIIFGMSILLGRKNQKTDTSNNILFYESIENENIKYDIDDYMNKAKTGFCILLGLIFFIFFLKNIQIFNFKTSSNSVFFGIILFIMIVGLILLFLYNNLDTQIISTEENEYNTTRNVYQNLLDGIKSNFTFIIALSGISIISYILILKLKNSKKSEKGFWQLVTILLGSFAYILPLVITIGECSFAMLYPIPFILGIILLRSLLYCITFLLKKIIHDGDKKINEVFAVIYELPVEYFEKMFSGKGIPENFPKTNPSGMPWNLASITIIKIIVLICSLLGIDTSNTYFTRMIPFSNKKKISQASNSNYV